MEAGHLGCCCKGHIEQNWLHRARLRGARQVEKRTTRVSILLGVSTARRHALIKLAVGSSGRCCRAGYRRGGGRPSRMHVKIDERLRDSDRKDGVPLRGIIVLECG